MVRHITYKQNQYPVRLSYRVFKGLKTSLSKMDLKNMDSMDPDFLEPMLWFGLISGHKFEAKELTLKREDMEDVLDECFIEFTKMIPEFFPNVKKGNKGNETPTPGTDQETLDRHLTQKE